MRRLNFETNVAAMQLAIDEAMLVWADDQTDTRDTSSIRFWEFQKPTLVLGRSSKVEDEVDVAFCQSREIEVLRRCTGGASVVAGPGCLMYSVVLRLIGELAPRKIDVVHSHVMSKILTAVQRQYPSAKHLGTCDLTLNGRKFSGNSLRITKQHLLYHGTLLVDADLDLIARCLRFAPRQPSYREGRGHRDFITNLRLDIPRFCDDVTEQFRVCTTKGVDSQAVRTEIFRKSIQLFESRYQDQTWHRKH